MTQGGRPAVLVWLLLSVLSASLLLHARFAAPRGTAFVGTFAYTDDFFNYLSQVEQAERGELLFKSKLSSPNLPAALLNLEWLSVGWLAALLGGRVVLAYRIFGLLAAAVFVVAADFWLTNCGLPPARKLSGLLLVFTGGGLGGLLYAVAQVPGERLVDLRTGAFPFVEILGNPHFVLGTMLLACSLGAFAAGRSRLGVALGLLLGMVRPYDATLLGIVEGTAVLVHLPVRAWPRRLAALVPLSLPLVYNALVFQASPGFRMWVNPHYVDATPAVSDLLLALGLAVLAALTSLLRPPLAIQSASIRPYRLRLQLWSAFALLVVLARPVSFSLQFIVGVGFPLLVLAATGLAAIGRHTLEAFTPLFALTAVVSTWLCLIPTPRTHPPAERWQTAAALRRSCRPGDIVLAPPDIGLFLGGLTACWPFVSHPAAPDYLTRREAVERFYDPATAPAFRAAFVDREGIAHVVAPANVPAQWLGPGPFRASFTVTAPFGALTVWSRDPPTGDRRVDPGIRAGGLWR